jgi:hypothetical protein
MREVTKLGLEEAEKRFKRINANVPEEQFIADETLTIARYGAADIYSSGFIKARDMIVHDLLILYGQTDDPSVLAIANNFKDFGEKEIE